MWMNMANNILRTIKEMTRKLSVGKKKTNNTNTTSSRIPN